MSYKPHSALSDKARASATLVRLIGGILLFCAVVVAIILLLDRLQWHLVPAEHQSAWAQQLESASTPLGLMVNLYAFGVFIIALALTLRLIHHRSWFSLIGGPAPAVSQFLRVSRNLIILHGVILLIPSADGMEASRNMVVGLWLMYLPFTLLGVLIQTGAEELLFRGYLQSQLAARFKSPLVWIWLPSVVFGFLHYNPNVDVTAAWVLVAWAACFGLAAADLTARAGTLGPALSLHFLNNAVIMAIIAAEGDFDGAALFTIGFDMSDSQLLMTWMPVEFLILLCSWLAARLALRV